MPCNLGIHSQNTRVIPRLLRRQVSDRLKRYPAVAILGPRQCGKTTLARSFGGNYLDLESAGDTTRLDAEWDALAFGKKRLVLDEAQCVPEVFARLRGAIDAERKRNGRFLILGSVSPQLMIDVSESLAGRMGIVWLTPFLLPEMRTAALDDLWLRGGYPDGGILQPDMFPTWQRDYSEALVSRDLPAWGLPARAQTTRRLLHMLAALQGQALNASQLGSALSINHKTALRYCDFLEGAFLIRTLPPFFTNIKKRLVRSKRVYWRDSGLLHALLGVSDLESLYRQPWVGASWEGYVVEQTLGVLEASGVRAEPFYFRTSDGHELDLVLDFGNERWAVEIKLTSSPKPSQTARLNKVADMVGARRRALVCRVARKIENERLLVTHLPGWLRELQSLGRQG